MEDDKDKLKRDFGQMLKNIQPAAQRIAEREQEPEFDDDPPTCNECDQYTDDCHCERDNRVEAVENKAKTFFNDRFTFEMFWSRYGELPLLKDHRDDVEELFGKFKEGMNDLIEELANDEKSDC